MIQINGSRSTGPQNWPMPSKPKRLSVPEMVATAVFVFSIAGLAVIVLSVR